MARRWIRLDVGWEDSEWLDALEDGTASGSWPRILCLVKRDGIQGRIKAPNLNVLARRWHVPRASLERLVEAAVKDEALVIEGGEWVITAWQEYQHVDKTAKDRMRKMRETQSGKSVSKRRAPGVTRNTRNNRNRGRNPSRATETETETEQITDEHPFGADAPSANGKQVSWSRRAAEIWQARLSGVAPGGRIGKALKPLMKKYDNEEVLGDWDRYLADMLKHGRGGFATPEDFAGRYGFYKEHGVKAPSLNGHTQADSDRRVLQHYQDIENVHLTAGGGGL